MKATTVFTLTGIVSTMVLAGIANAAINECMKLRAELNLATVAVDLGGLAMDLQESRIKKLEKEIKELKGEA